MSTGWKRKITINDKQNNEIKEKEKFHDKNKVDNFKKKNSSTLYVFYSFFFKRNNYAIKNS